MEGLILLVVVALLFFAAGSILSFTNRSAISTLTRQIRVLVDRVDVQAQQIAQLKTQLKEQGSTTTPLNTKPDEQVTVASSVVPAKPVNPPPVQRPTIVAQQKKVQATASARNTFSFDFEQFIRANGLLWLGGLVLAIGGIFLARYSIEAGLLPPIVRVLMGTLFGIGLVASAEYLARHRKRFQLYSVYVSAALASGGVITCFAMALVAYDYYEFINAQAGFGLLAVISLAATSLSLRFGPLLAWIGVIGAYAVPVLVNTGSGNVSLMLLYTAFVSASAVWISQAVSQIRLWWFSFAANCGWFVVAVMMANSSHFHAMLLFTLFSLYLFVVSDLMGWRLRASMTHALPVKTLLMPRKEHLGIVLPLYFLAVYLVNMQTSSYYVEAGLVVTAVFWLAPVRYSVFDSWPYLALIFSGFVYSQLPEPSGYADISFLFTGRYLYAQGMAFSALLYCTVMYRAFQRPAYLLLMVLASVGMLALSYVLSPDEANALLYPVWASELAVIAIAGAVVAQRLANGLLRITLHILANACVTLCLTMLLDAAALTLAIALQIGTMSYLSWKINVALPAWLYKSALTVVTVRLTFAPWLDSYRDETIAGLHWTMVIYPLVLAILWGSRRYHALPDMQRWLEGAFLHVLMLLVTTETSYLLVGDYPDFSALAFNQAALLSCNWLIMALAYRFRAARSKKVARLYNAFAIVLCTAACMLHLDVSLVRNPFLTSEHTGDGLLINWLIILWAMPALLFAGAEKWRLVPARFRTAGYVLSGMLFTLYINGIIRGGFHHGYLVLNRNFEQAELYCYSIVWLLIATGLIFVGQQRHMTRLRNVGFSLLAIVLFKTFFVDMANLEGLYRAVSFIGLGFSLVGIGWLFQKLNRENDPDAATS